MTAKKAKFLRRAGERITPAKVIAQLRAALPAILDSARDHLLVLFLINHETVLA
jgi:hypothetical protein